MAENRWIYFVKSGIVLGLISLLMFFTLRYVIYEQRMEILKEVQKELTYIKPNQDGNESFYKWIYIGNPLLRHQQYSAYFDPRIEVLDSADYNEQNKSYGSVRTFAVLPLKSKFDMTCVYGFDDCSTQVVTPGEILPINEHEDLDFAVYTIMCPLVNVNNSPVVELPHSVALSYDDNPKTLKKPTFIPITYPRSKDILRNHYRYLAVCVSPLPNQYNNVLRIVEFIEMYELLGAEKFYFYTSNVSIDVNKLLNFYEETDIVEQLNWDFDRNPFQYEIKYANILGQMNDCLYRATFKDGFKHIAMVNIDEIIMPLQLNTLVEYIEGLEDRHRSTSFNFDTVFFHENYETDHFNVPPNFNNTFLYTQIKIERSSSPLPVRSRYIVVGRYVVEVGNHQVWRGLHDFTKSGKISNDDALVFNYRTKCLFIICGVDSTVDFTARRYGSLLWYQVENVCNIVFKNENGICTMK